MRLATVSDLELPAKRRIRVREYPGGGTPVVLLHGLLDSSEGWHPLATSSDRRVIAVDLPGFGGSTCPPYDRIASYARDVACALDQLGLERYAVVGHSFGGAVATAIAEQRPHAVIALVLIAPAGYGRIALAELVMRPGIRQAVQAGLPFTLGNPVAMAAIYALCVGNGAGPDLALVSRSRRDAFRVVGGARQAVQTIVRCGLDRRAFFRRRIAYDGPVVVLWGDRDRLVPAVHARRVLTTFPQADVHVWEGMGHHPQRERPRPFAAFVERACRTADAGPAASEQPPLAA